MLKNKSNMKRSFCQCARFFLVVLFTIQACLSTAVAEDKLTIKRIDKPSGQQLIPEDTAIIEIVTPEVEPQCYEISPLKPDRFRSSTFNIPVPGGETVEKKLALKGGQYVTVPISAAKGKHPPLIVQRPSVIGSPLGLTFSADDRFLVTHDHCNLMDVWEIDSGLIVRRVQHEGAGCYDGRHQTYIRAIADTDDALVLVDGNGMEVVSLIKGKTVFNFDSHWDPVILRDGRRFLLQPLLKRDINNPIDTRDEAGKLKLSQSVYLFDAISGKRLRSFRIDAPVDCYVASPDQSRVAIKGTDNAIRLFDVVSGQKVKTLNVPEHLSKQPFMWNAIGLWTSKKARFVRHGMDFSSDGRQLILRGAEGKQRNQNVDDGIANYEREYSEPTDSVHLEWNLVTGDVTTKRRQLEKHRAYSSDGSLYVVWATPSRLSIRRSADDVVVSHLNNYPEIPATYYYFDSEFDSADFSRAAFSHDNRLLATSDVAGSLIVWDVQTGQSIRTLHPPKPLIPGPTPAPRMPQELVDRGWQLKSVDYQMNSQPASGGRVIKRSLPDFSNDDSKPVEFDYPEVRDAKTGKLIRRIPERKGGSWQFALSRDGTRLLSVHEPGSHYMSSGTSASSPPEDAPPPTAFIADTDTGGNVVTLDLMALNIGFDNHILNSRQDVAILGDHVFDSQTGKYLGNFEGSTYIGYFSGDGLTLVGGYEPINVSNVADRKLVREIPWSDIRYGGLNAVSRSGRYVIQDGRLYDVATGDTLADLYDGLVVTPEGLFDGDAEGRQSVAYRVDDGLHVAPVDRFFNELYHPGLLADLLDGRRPMPSRGLEQLVKNKPPKLKIVSPERGGEVSASNIDVTVEVHEQGGGITGPFVRLNGQRLKLKPIVESEDDSTFFTFTVPLTESDNRIRIESATEDGAFESDPATLQITNVRKLARPNLYVVTIGVNDYADSSMNLTCAKGDAEAIGKLFESRARKLFENVEVHRLLDSDVTADRIKTLLTDESTGLASRVEPKDALVLFVAGHGYTIDDNRYYFLPHNFEKQSRSYEKDVRNQGIPGDVLGDWISAVKATKRVVILDTCNAGSAVAQLSRTRNPFAFDGAIERLSRTQGVHVIAAASAQKEAREITSLQHGVLTYSLLAGMNAVNNGPLAENAISSSPTGAVSVNQWFEYAQAAVPALYKKYIGEQQDVQVRQGNSFPLLSIAP